MMSALEKAKALREFRQLRDQLADSGLKPLEKIKALKRFRELRGMFGETAVVPFDTSEFAGPGDISGATFYVKNPQNGADVPVASIEEAAAKYKEFMQRTNADRPAGMDVYSAETFQPVANIKADGSWTKVETREEAQARAEEAIPTAASKSADDMFASDEIEKLRVQKYKSREKLISMKIADFLKMAAKGIDKEKEAGVNALISSGKQFSDLPFLKGENYGDVLRITGHEGRHRARKLLEMGYKYMPVVLIIGPGSAPSIRWSEQNDPNKFDYVQQWPTKMKGEDGDVMPFPVSREDADSKYKAGISGGNGDADIADTAPALADTSLLTGIISGQIDTFKDKAKLQELSDSLAKAGGDDMPAGEVRDLFEKAIRAAGVQVLTGFGYLEAAA